jgi:hypothetical protein
VKKDGNIVSYTVEELEQMRARGESKTDWARVDAMTEAELEAAIASDPDWADIPPTGTSTLRPIIPTRCASRSGCASIPICWPGSSARGPATTPASMPHCALSSRRMSAPAPAADHLVHRARLPRAGSHAPL